MGEAGPPRSYLRQAGEAAIQTSCERERDGSQDENSTLQITGVPQAGKFKGTRKISNWKGPLGLFPLPFYLGKTWSRSPPRVARGKVRLRVQVSLVHGPEPFV